MLINEVCKECNLTKKAVEYYTEQGLIQPRITENGYRQFSETDALKLKRIAVLRGLGFSVPEIRTILENDSRTAIYDVLNRKELEIVELQTKQALIKQLAESGDWEQIEGQVEALQNKQSILNRIHRPLHAAVPLSGYSESQWQEVFPKLAATALHRRTQSNFQSCQSSFRKRYLYAGRTGCSPVRCP